MSPSTTAKRPFASSRALLAPGGAAQGPCGAAVTMATMVSISLEQGTDLEGGEIVSSVDIHLMMTPQATRTDTRRVKRILMAPRVSFGAGSLDPPPSPLPRAKLIGVNLFLLTLYPSVCSALATSTLMASYCPILV
jgi:hypothetical protein